MLIFVYIGSFLTPSEDYVSSAELTFSCPNRPPGLAHYPYINTLPSSKELWTPLYFTELELEAFKGSSLYHATIDRRNILKEEWKQCQSVLNSKNVVWGENLTW